MLCTIVEGAGEDSDCKGRESEESLAGQSEKPSMSSCPNGSTAEGAGASVGSCVLYIEDAPGSASEHRW